MVFVFFQKIAKDVWFSGGRFSHDIKWENIEYLVCNTKYLFIFEWKQLTRIGSFTESVYTQWITQNRYHMKQSRWRCHSKKSQGWETLHDPSFCAQLCANHPELFAQFAKKVPFFRVADTSRCRVEQWRWRFLLKSFRGQGTSHTPSFCTHLVLLVQSSHTHNYKIIVFSVLHTHYLSSQM